MRSRATPRRSDGEKDGQVEFGWNVPHYFNGKAGGQPPDAPTFSAPGTYKIARHANVSFDTCADAETTMLGATADTIPFEAETGTNQPPELYLSSSAGSAVEVDEVTDIHAEATDPDRDIVTGPLPGVLGSRLWCNGHVTVM